MSHTVSGQTANDVWDVNRSVPEVLQDGTNTYVYGLGRISATDGSGNQTYYDADGLGSTSDLTNSAATKTDGYTYDAFGTATHSPGGSANSFQFTGQQSDADSGLQYLRARYYDPSTGRFLSQDSAPMPLTRPAAGNRYAYVGNNPASWIDPSGLWCPADPSDCIPQPVKDWGQDRVDDVASAATHVVHNPTNLLNGGVANEVLGATISAFSSCHRQEKEGGIVIYENCTGGLAHLISKINGGRAFTVGSFIFSPRPILPDVLRHELCHVRQYDNWAWRFCQPTFSLTSFQAQIRSSPTLTAVRLLTFTASIVLLTCAVLGTGCQDSAEKGITFVNATQQTLLLAENGVQFTTLMPGQSAVFQGRESLFPERFQAYNGDQLVHDHTVTWDELKANNFVYVINGTIDQRAETTAPTSTHQQE